MHLNNKHFSKYSNSVKSGFNYGLLNLVIAVLAITFISCEKDDYVSVFDDDNSNPGGFTDLSKHNTSTDPVETAEGEVVLSLVLSASEGTRDAVIYYSADNMDFDNSIYLKAGVNIVTGSVQDGPYEKGVKFTLPGVDISGRNERIYYFKVMRPAEDDKILHFGFQILKCGTYCITDSNLSGREQDFAYYIKPDGKGDPEFINVKFK